MSNKKYTSEEELDFFTRLTKVEGQLPADYVKQTLQRIPEVNPSRIQNVKYKRSIDFDILEVFEEIATKK